MKINKIYFIIMNIAFGTIMGMERPEINDMRRMEDVGRLLQRGRRNSEDSYQSYYSENRNKSLSLKFKKQNSHQDPRSPQLIKKEERYDEDFLDKKRKNEPSGFLKVLQEKKTPIILSTALGAATGAVAGKTIIHLNNQAKNKVELIDKNKSWFFGGGNCFRIFR